MIETLILIAYSLIIIMLYGVLRKLSGNPITKYTPICRLIFWLTFIAGWIKCSDNYLLVLGLVFLGHIMIVYEFMFVSLGED